MISISNLNKSYRSNQVFNNFNLNIDEGKVYGMLGRNGSGKTTLLKILSNQIVNYSGDVTYNGAAIRENEDVVSKIIFVGDGYNKNNTLTLGKVSNF